MDRTKNSLAVDKLMGLALAHINDGIKNSKWFQSAPVKYKLEAPPVSITGIEYPTATRTEDECFPCIAVEVFRPRQRTLKTLKDLRELGNNFDTLQAAFDAAKKVHVIGVNDYGDVNWVVKSE